MLTRNEGIITVKELLGICGQYDDFEIQFSFTDACEKFSSIRTFSNLELCDVEYSDRIICLTGNELTGRNRETACNITVR